MICDLDTQDVTLRISSFTVTESAPMRFIPIFTGDCMQTPGSIVASGTISTGQNLLCNITNTQT
jgi:hypothetical protein